MAMLVVPFVLSVAALSFTSQPRLAASNAKVTASRIAIPLDAGEERCQGGEFVPKGAGYVRMYGRWADEPGALQVSVIDRRGVQRSTGGIDGADSGPLMVPIEEPASDVSRGRLCIKNTDDGTLMLAGDLTPLNPQTAVGPPSPGAGPDDEVRADFYYGEHRSWAAMFDTISRRFALFKPSFVGTWALPVVLVVILLTCTIGALLVLYLAAASSRTRALAAGVAAIAALMGAAWAMTTPPYQVPDEFAHVEYAEYVGDYNELPPIVDDDRRKARDRRDDHGEIYYGMPFSVEGKPSWDPEDDAAVDGALRRQDLPTSHASGPGGASSGPPAYYALQAIVAKATDPLPATDRLFAMRLLSVAMGAALVTACFLFLTQVLPGRPMAAVVGALAVSLHPVVTFLSGGVSNDNLLYLLSAVLLAIMGRIFRAGISPATAVALGVTLGLGELTKSRAILVMPATVLGLALLVVSTRRGRRRHAAGLSVLALLVFAVIDVIWLTISRNVLARSTAGTSALASDAGSQASSLRGVFSYVWQSFLPRLPFMEPQFTEYPRYPLWDVYVEGFIGRFGWFEYGFPAWVNVVGALILVAIGSLAALSLWRRRVAVRRRWAELLTYLAYAGSLPVFLAVAGYDYRNRTGYNLEQTRYLFPLLALYGGVVALAVLAVPRARRPLATGIITGLFSCHMLASFILTIDRYYV